jgi:DNA-binding IclR family transcriptional regulator
VNPAHGGGAETAPARTGRRAKPATARTADPPLGAGSLRHGLALLEAFSPEEPALSIGKIAARIGLHKSTVSRLARTLSETGYLEVAGSPGVYRLGPKLMRLAAAIPDDRSVTEVAAPLVRQLVADTGETGHLAVLDGTEVLTIFVADGWRSIRMHASVGKRSPAHASAAGKALLACHTDQEVRDRMSAAPLSQRTKRTVATVEALQTELCRVRSEGIAIDDEELEVGLRCFAAPLFDPSGEAVAGIALSGPAERIFGTGRSELERSLKRTADDISRALGGSPKRSEG